MNIKWPWSSKKEQPVQVPEVIAPRAGSFGTDMYIPSQFQQSVELRQRQANALKRTFQRGINEFTAVELDTGMPLADATFAMDDSYPDLTAAKLINSASGNLPIAQLEYFSNQGFIGWQMCTMLSQNWVIQKACAMPAEDAVRHGWKNSAPSSVQIDADVFAEMSRIDKRMKIKKNCREFIKNGRVFGIRHALFIVEGIDYELPFNPDGVKPNSYKGITQIDPYWIAPMLDRDAAANPAAMDFYEPTWWMLNGKRIHKSHFVIYRNGDDVPDILKPSYLYGGIPTTQKIFERVYGAERCANEAPMLLMTKRLTCLQLDLTEAGADPQAMAARMELWSALMNNYGIKVIGEADNIQQFDTSLSELSATITGQYELVAAAADVPAHKLLGTSPTGGIGSSGNYDESSYHEFLESKQENDLAPLIDAHNIRMIRSYIAPKFSIAPFECDVSWNPVDSPTASEQAELNLKKAQTGSALVASGAIDGYDERQRIIADADSGYNGIADVVPDGPGDRDAQQEADEPLQMPVTAKSKPAHDAQDSIDLAPALTVKDVMDMIDSRPQPAPNVQTIQPVINITNQQAEFPALPAQAAPVVNVSMPEMVFTNQQPAIQIDNHIPMQKQGDVQINMPEQKAAAINITMPDVKVNVATPSISIDANIQPNEVNVSLPARKTETTVQYDRDGNIKSTTQIESDA